MGHHLCTKIPSRLIALIRTRQALPCYLERRSQTEQGRSTRRFLGRAASRAPQQHDRHGRWTPTLFIPLLRCAVPRAGLSAGATLQGEERAFLDGRGGSRAAPSRPGPRAQHPLRPVLAPVPPNRLARRLNGFALCAFLSNAKPREAQCEGGTRRAARAGAARVSKCAGRADGRTPGCCCATSGRHLSPRSLRRPPLAASC